MTNKSKVTLALAPLACLLCPAHLLGYLLAAVGGARIAAHHEVVDVAISALALVAAGAIVWRWERRKGHHHCDHDHRHPREE